MSGAIYQFTAPNGVVYRISEAPNEEAARQRVRQYFKEEFPEEYSAWERSQPTAGFGEAFMRSARSAAGGQATGLGLQLQERGLPGGETLQEAGRAIEGEAPLGSRLLDSETVLEDLRQRPLRTLSTGLGQALGSTLGSVAAPAALGAGAVALGAPVGIATTGAAVLGGLLSGTSELYQGLISEGVPTERARELAANIGAAIGAAEGGAAGPIVRQILGTSLRREATERIAEIAGRSATRSALREGTQAAALEGASEATAGAARQAIIAGETGNVDLERRAANVALEGILGAVGGGGVGAAAGSRAPSRARAELESRLTPEERAAREAASEEPLGAEQPAETEAPVGPSPLVRERPSTFQSEEEATPFLQQNEPPAELRTPEARVAWANALQDAKWQSEVEAARPVALSEFTGEVPAQNPDPVVTQFANDTFLNNLAEAASLDQVSLTRITPKELTAFIFQQRGLNIKPTAQDIQQVQSRLDQLVAQNYLESPTDNVYRISTKPTAAASPASTPPQQPSTPAAPPIQEAPQPTPVQPSPETPAASSGEMPAAPPSLTPAPGMETAPVAPTPETAGPTPLTPPAAPAVPTTEPAAPATPVTPAAAEPAPTIDPGAPAVNASPAVQQIAKMAPEVQAAEQALQSIATTGEVAPPPPQPSAELWRGYALAFGPEANNPVVIAARTVARARKRELSLNEFNTFVNAWSAMPTDFDRGLFLQQIAQQPRLIGGPRLPEFTAPQAPPPAQPATPAAPPDGAPAAPVAADAPAPTSPAAPAATPAAVPQTPENLWQAYSQKGGAAPAAPVIQAARAVSSARGRPMAQPEFTEFVQAYEAAPTPQDRRAVLNSYRARPAAPAERDAAPTSRPTAQPATGTGAPMAEPVGEQASEIPGPPSEAIAEDAGAAPEIPEAARKNRIAQAMAGILPESPVEGQAILNRAIATNLFSKAGRWFGNTFGSPITTLPEWRPELRNVARVQRFFDRRHAQANSELQNLVARNMAQFNYDEYATMTRRLFESSEQRKPFNREGLSPQMIAKMEDIQRAYQRAFDMFIEANAISYYDPKEAKTPGQQERLLQMWERNKGKNLLQISQQELRLASPDGFNVIQRLEALRNPYYFVSTSDGKTHFVAVYPKGPDGKRKPGARPLKMVPVNPLTPRLKLRGAPDPVALAYEELAARGYTSDKYYITPKPVEFTRDSEMAQIRDNSDFLASFVEKLQQSVGNNAEAQSILRNMMTSLDKAKMEAILRPNQNILLPITKQNEVSYLLTAVPQNLAGLAKLQARRYTEHSFRRSIQNLAPADQKYWTTLRDYASAPAEAAWISKARTLNYHWYMGFAVDTALLDATQYFTGTLPLISKDGGSRGIAIANSTVTQVFSKYASSPSKGFGRDVQKFVDQISRELARNPEEARAIKAAAAAGVFDPIHTTEIGGISDVDIREGLLARGIKNPEAIQKAADTVINLSGSLKRTAETFNRLTAFLAAYRLGSERPDVISKVNRLEGHAFTNAFDYAVNRVDETQTIAGASDRPLFMRFLPGAELVTQFMSFTHKMTELWLSQGRQVLRGLMKSDPEMAKAGAFGLLCASVPTMLFAGIWGLPGFKMLREGVEALINLVWKDSRNLDDELREYAGDGFWAKFLTRGLPHASGFAATSERMGLDPIPIQEISSWNPLQILGPIGGSLPESIFNFAAYSRQGDWLNAWASIAPRVLGNGIRGYNLEYGTREYRSPSGNVIVSEQQLNDINNRSLIPVPVRQALGLQSPAVADLRDAYRVGREVQMQNRSYAENLNRDLARAEANRIRALREGDAQRAAEAREELHRLLIKNAERNEQFRDSADEDKRYQVNMSTVRRRALEMIYGVTSPEIMGRTGRPAVRSELQEIQRRYAPQ